MGKADKVHITMKMMTLILIQLIALTDLFAQTDTELKSLIDNFVNIKDMPYICVKVDNKFTSGCGDSIFWKAIINREKIIPYLIDRLNDTTISKASVPNFGGEYRIADISLFALNIIIWHIPVLDLAEDADNSEERNGSWGYWDYTRRNYENRIKFRERVSDWYMKNKNRLVWIDSKEIAGCDCRDFKNPAGGHFEVKK